MTDPTQGSCLGGEAPGTRPFSGTPVHDASRSPPPEDPRRSTRRARVARATVQSPMFLIGIALTAVGTYLTYIGHADLGGVLIAVGSALGGGNAVHRMRGGSR